jgi:Type II secretion system (T2SS), protein G
MRRIKTLPLAIGTLSLGMLFILCLYSCANSHQSELSPPKKLTMDRMFQFAKLCSQYKRLVGSWPTNTVSLAGVVRITNRSVLQDGWGNPFVFYTDSPGTTFFIISHGADGKPKGITRDDGDITWTLNKPIE